jgi:enoyl-[acyl-carrier protein] reductase III
MGIEKPWVFILGISGAMGKAIAIKMAEKGYPIAGVFRERRANADNFLKELEDIKIQYNVQVRVWNADAISENERKRILDAWQNEGLGEIAILVHAIAKGNLKPLSAENQWERMQETDLLLTLQSMATSWFAWSSDILHRSLFCPLASNIALSSEGARRIWPSYSAVGMAKAALENSAKSMAVNWGCKKLRTNIIVAGITDTPALRKIPGQEILLQEAAQKNPLGRNTLASDVANVVYLLSLPEANFLNGAKIHVNGGEHLI